MDDSEPEFPIPTRKELEIIKNYFNVESQFIAVTEFFTVPRTILFRKLAVSIIAKLSRSDDPDSFTPYLARNYFNRFLSKHKLNLEDVEGCSETERVHLTAVSCLTISAKMRTNSFSCDRFLENLYRDMNVRMTPPMVTRMELLILQELQWAMRSEHVKECVKKMVDLCNRLNIQIETTESGTHSTTSKVAAVPLDEIKEAGTSEEEDEDEQWNGLINQEQDMGNSKPNRVKVLVQEEDLADDEVTVASGNEVMVADTSDILDIAEVELKWPTDYKARIKVRSGQCRRFCYLLCIVLLLMQNCGSVTAASSFDYYRLSETWVGTYCTSKPCDKSLADDRFTIHGLWFDSYPKHCPIEPPSQKNTNKLNYETPPDLLEALTAEWPSLGGGQHNLLWEYEWRKHGVSVGFCPKTYLKTALEFHNQCRVQKALAKAGIKPSGAEISVESFKKALEEYNLGKTELVCNKRNQLTEVRCCFSRGIKKRIKCPRKYGHRCEETLIYQSLGDAKPPRDEL